MPRSSAHAPVASTGEAARVPTTTRQRSLRALFTQASRIVAREYASQVLVDEVAARLCTSRRQLQRAYHVAGHPGLRAQLAQVRMEHAARMVCAPDPPTITQLAQRVGYRSHSQFIKAFHRHYGMTPTAYRRAHRHSHPLHGALTSAAC